MFCRPFFAVVSFVLFLIALTFPVEATTEECEQYTQWLRLLFRVLPMNALIKDALNLFLEGCISSRKQFVQLVFALHEYVLGVHLHPKNTLAFFQSLRASDCNRSDNEEGGCTKQQHTGKNVCLVRFHSDKHVDCFALDNGMVPDTQYAKQWLTDSRSFCSCLFSAKWFLLHMVASHYPVEPSPEDKQNYAQWLALFGNVLACSACRQNFKKNVVAVEYSTHDLASRYAFERLIYRLHSAVNGMLGQPNIAFADMKRMFANLEQTVQDTDFGMIRIAPKTETRYHNSVK